MPWDQLFLLERSFADPSLPGREFYCWQCLLLDGVLSAFPSRAAMLDVRRIAWAKPRTALIERLGQDHQSAPVLILEKGARAPEKAKCANGLAYVDDPFAILQCLAVRHGFPALYPGRVASCP
ncbi:DUF3088 domain-containing protein [Bradyrhizobium pachyrhizi]|uniref:DUF3088 domain-containing protein n=1 Tax=Bradyrhizobium pachyrhizi TaxID=280333 RepID=UPI0024B0E2C7|nr:DUF3088 domain-containing protein [Bradyrhizobium pachyrhizi]WFU54549.1 DUF3088 domain-containing protein [Bradyrhizobium pachyrhizi]